jgi:hypothetical protein
VGSRSSVNPMSQAAKSAFTAGVCAECRRLLEGFGEVVQELLELHEQQFLAIVNEDSDCSRFDLLIHMVNEKKQEAKYAYLCHVEAHGCSKDNVTD